MIITWGELHWERIQKNVLHYASSRGCQKGKKEKRKKNKWKYIQNELRTVVIFSSVCLQGQLLRWLETGTGFADCWSEIWDWHYFRFEHRLFLSFSLPVLFWFLSRDCCFRILVVVWSCCIFCASVVETGTGSGSQCNSYAPFMLFGCFLCAYFCRPEVFMSFVTNRQGSQISANYNKAGG